MQHFLITFTDQQCGTSKKYCYFSLSIERAKELMPLRLLNMDIHEDVIYKITTRVFFEGIYRIVHNLRIKCEVDEWLKEIDAKCVSYIKHVKVENKDEVCVRAIGSFGLDLSDVNPEYKNELM